MTRRSALAALLACAASAMPGLAQRVQLPAYTRQVLPNGLTLDLMPKHGVPLITLQAVIRGGAEADPPERAGLDWLTAELLRRGTTTRTAAQFADQLDAMGATFDTRTNEQASYATIEFLSKDRDLAVPLFADALLHPAFTAAEVAQRTAQAIDGAKALKDEPNDAARLYFRSFFFGGRHPYGRPVRGDEQTLARVQREQIVEAHSRQYVGRNMILIAVGDFDPAVLGPQLAQTFGSLPPGRPYSYIAAPVAAAASQPRLLLIDKPDATQTYFYIGQPGIARTNPDRVPLLLVNTLFGGRFTSMLNDELRVNTGLTYGAGSSLEQRRLPGVLQISTYTKTETTSKAMDLALEVLGRLQKNGLTAEQLASAKAYVKGTYPTERLETADQLADLLTDLELNDLTREEIDGLYGRIDAVTLEQANAAARRYYRTENLTFVVLGNAKQILPEIKKYAPKLVSVPVTNPGFSAPEAVLSEK